MRARQVSSTDVVYGPVAPCKRYAVSGYGPIALCKRCQMPSTGVVSASYVTMSGTDVGYGATRTYGSAGKSGRSRRILPRRKKRCAICLRACYAMSSTDLAYGTAYAATAIWLRAWHAMCGTDLAYGATQADMEPPPSDLLRTVNVTCQVSAYARATRSAVLT
eukprot:1427229-Rhodomonas_salina.2